MKKSAAGSLLRRNACISGLKHKNYALNYDYNLLEFCFCFFLSTSSQQRIFFIPYCFLVNSSTNYQCIYRLLPSFFKRVVSGFQPAVLSAACYSILTQDRDFRRGHRVDFSATSTDDGAPTVFYTAKSFPKAGSSSQA